MRVNNARDWDPVYDCEYYQSKFPINHEAENGTRRAAGLGMVEAATLDGNIKIKKRGIS